MTELSKGANIALSTVHVRASLRWETGSQVPVVDASALLLGPEGKVGGDEDFVFYNQPSDPSGAVEHLHPMPGPRPGEQLRLDLDRVPDSVDRIVLAATTDQGSFGQVPNLQLVLIDADTSEEVVSFRMSATTETAIVCGEVYRRNGAWKFRAVGQGYLAGLSGLAADFGVDVDVDPQRSAEPPAAPVNPAWPFPTPPPPGLAPPGLLGLAPGDPAPDAAATSPAVAPAPFLPGPAPVYGAWPTPTPDPPSGR